MDLELSDEQAQLDDALEHLFSRHAGTERAKELSGGLDAPLMAALADAGYLDVGFDGGPIEAMLVVERAARHVACGPIAARALVAPLAGIKDLPANVSLVHKANSITRHATTAEAFVMLDGDVAKVFSPDQVEVEPVESRFGYPVARVRPIANGSTVANATDVRRAWQVAIAAEIAATALSAVQIAAHHVTERHQFGKPIGSFQAVQHRLSLSFAQANAATWLARRAAWFSHDESLTAAAAAYACGAAELAYTNTHQVSGAIGITTEFGLTARTMRLISLQHDLGGRIAHCRHLVTARRTRTSDPALAPIGG